MSATEQPVSDCQQVIDWFKKQGLDLVPLMKEVDDSPPQNPIDAVRREIAVQRIDCQLMGMFAYEYGSGRDSWWDGYEMTIAEAVKLWQGEGPHVLWEYAVGMECKEEELFDRVRESEGAVKSLENALAVLQGMKSGE